MFLKLFYLAFGLTIGQSLGQDIKSSVPEDQEVSRSPRYWTGRNILDVVVVRTANGSGCGMGVLGFISVLICRNDGECCQTGELHTFTEGKEKKFTSDNLQSCFGFDLQDPVDPITLKVQHAGKDAGCFEWVRPLTNQGYYDCILDPTISMTGGESQMAKKCIQKTTL